MNADLAHAYNQVITGCGLVDFDDHARLWAAGRDRIDLIHRMSTNDLLGMAVNEGRATVLTTAIARMVDRIVVINLGERALILGSAGTAALIRRWLSGYIFFNDEVTFIDAADELSQFVLFGPKAAVIAESLATGASRLKQYHVLQSADVILGRGDRLAGESFFVVGPRDAVMGWREKAVAAGAVVAAREVYEVARVESGLPEYGHEIGEAFIPLEAGLWGDVSFAKGCYIGQEIIARMESRGKLAKTLVGIRAGRPVAAGTSFPGGTVTSVVQSPRFGWIGLAFVKPSEADAGMKITFEDMSVTVASLPFVD